MFTQKNTFIALRWSLGIVFTWFGVLKLFNVSPSLELIKQTTPFFSESQFFLFLVSFIEILIGAALLMNRFVKAALIVMMVSVTLVSFTIFFTQGFSPRFPILSLAGELVLKNLVVVAAGLVLLTYTEEPVIKKTKE